MMLAANHHVLLSPAGVKADMIGVGSLPRPVPTLRLDFNVRLGPLFYCWTIQMLLPTLVMQLVQEKEKRLRAMMRLHGLGNAAYWAVTYAWYLILYLAYMAVFVGFGAAIGLKIFIYNDSGTPSRLVELPSAIAINQMD